MLPVWNGSIFGGIHVYSSQSVRVVTQPLTVKARARDRESARSGQRFQTKAGHVNTHVAQCARSRSFRCTVLTWPTHATG